MLIGTLLGDAYLQPSMTKSDGPRAQLHLEHGYGQGAWIRWKHAVLKDLFNSYPKLRTRTINGREYKTWRVASKLFSALVPVHRMFYAKADGTWKKQVTPALLDQVDDLALAVWFCDDGSRGKSSRSLYLGGLTDDEYVLIQGWLALRCIKTTMHYDARYNCVQLSIGSDSWRILQKVCLKQIPDYLMREKIGR